MNFPDFYIYTLLMFINIPDERIKEIAYHLERNDIDHDAKIDLMLGVLSRFFNDEEYPGISHFENEEEENPESASKSPHEINFQIEYLALHSMGQMTRIILN